MVIAERLTVGRRAVALGAVADAAVVLVGAFVAVDLLLPAGWLAELDPFVLALVILVGVSGFAARRAVRREAERALRAREELAEVDRQRESFLELSDRVLAGAPLDDLFERAAASVARHLGVSHVGLFELRPDRGDLLLRAGTGWEAGAVGSAAIGAGPESHARTILAAFAPVATRLGHETLFANPPLLRGAGILRGLGTRVADNGRPFGILGAYATEPGAFRESDARYLHLVSTLLTSALRRNRAEEELRRSEERFRLALELTQIGTWDDDVVSGGGTWSSGLCEMFGVAPGGRYGVEDFVERLHPDDRHRITETIAAHYAAGGEYELEDYRIVRPDGEIRSVYARGSVVLGENGAPVRVLGVALDVTERRRGQQERAALEDQLRQAQKMEAVGQLAGGIAHDFNNLLLVMRGYGEMALRALARGEDVRGEVEEMLASAERAAALTGQLLAFSRRQILQPQVVDLNVTISGLEKLLGRLIGEDVAVTTVPAADAVCVSADQGQLEQVIANLALNAREAMPDGGELTIEVGVADVGPRDRLPLDPGRYAVLAVEDTGSGMEPEVAARIFEPFFTTKEGVGTGLGLSTVHGIVKQSGGHVWVYSEPDLGTTFKIYLPLVDETPKPRTSAAPAPAGRGETILLVEDDPEVRSLVREMLFDAGYRVLVAEGGDEAIDIAAANGAIHLVLTDVVMRGLNGRQTVEHLRTANPDVAVLYMSGYTDDAVLRRGAVERGTAFLQKPFGSEDLARKVRQVLDAGRSG